MALTVSTGFVVDDAIVVLENITRHVEAGMPLQAALRGAREVGFTVLSMSLSLIAVFIPILLMGGIIGRFFREFAITLSVAMWSRWRFAHDDADDVRLLAAAAQHGKARAVLRRLDRVFDGMPAPTSGRCDWGCCNPGTDR